MDGSHNIRVAAIVLAAGKSSRMGEAKQLLRLGETTVLGRTAENVCAASVDEVVIVLGASAMEIREQLPAPVLAVARVVVNRAYEEGMASSLKAGLGALSSGIEAALIVLGDQPFVRPATLDRISGEYRRKRAQIVVPLHQGVRGNPVLLGRSLFAEAMALEGDMGSRSLFPKYTEATVYVEVDDPGILLDIDSRDDYERLRRLE